MKYFWPSGLLLFALALIGLFVYVTTYRNLTPLESVFFQVVILLFGLLGTFWIGRILPANRSHARSAFRRVTSIYAGLSRGANIIEESRDLDTVENYRVAFARLEEVIRNQLTTADDALEDWADIVPKEVRDLREKLPGGSWKQE